MKTIRKYQGGATLAAAVPEVMPLIIPAALAWTLKYTADHPESTGMYIGMREAAESLRAAYAQMEAEELAQIKAAAKARNNQIAEHYARELANGPIVKTYANGTTTTITGYDPNTGRLTTTMDNPIRGWTFEGTTPELQYNYLNGVNLDDELSGVVNTKYGTFTPEIDYVDWNNFVVKPGTLIEGLPKITTSQPIDLNYPVTINPRAMTLSNGRVVVLPSTLPATNLYDSPVSGTVAIDRLTNVSQPIVAPLEMDFFMSKKKNKSKNNAKPEETPKQQNSDPKNPEDNWWKKLGKSFTDSFKRSSKEMGAGFTKGADATMKAVGYSLPPIITLGTIAGLTYGGYKVGEHFGFWGDENQQEAVKQEQSEPTYDSANLKEMIKRRDERRIKTDSLNNADKQKGGL